MHHNYGFKTDAHSQITGGFLLFQAVKKSRDKSKKKAAETQQRVDHLKRENLLLEAKISYHKDRLRELKEIFLTHASKFRAFKKLC